MDENKKLAVLIDSENVSSKYVNDIFDELSNMGSVTVRRIYGDWSKSVNGWSKDCLLAYSITAMQHFAYTSGKNSTDSAMIIDAMDLLYTGNLDGFCLVTSDSDFTRLAERLRESGKLVIGMGENKTPNAFKNACTSFKLLEALAKEDMEAGRKNDEEKVALNVTDIKEIKRTIYKIIDENDDRGKLTHLGEIGSKLQNKFSDFDTRNYGYTKLTTFLSEGMDKAFQICRSEKQTYLKIRQGDQTAKDDIKAMIIKILEDNSGEINNMSVINDNIKKEYTKFSVKKYGYSKFSSFLKSFDCFDVRENIVKLKR